MPSILSEGKIDMQTYLQSFKPCYKWNAFNTTNVNSDIADAIGVLNLVVNGMPSIRNNNWEIDETNVLF